MRNGNFFGLNRDPKAAVRFNRPPTRWERVRFLFARLWWRFVALFLLIGCGGPVGVVRTGEPLDEETEQAVAWWEASGEAIHMTCNEHDAHCVAVRYVPEVDCRGEKGWGCTDTADFTLAKAVTISEHVPPEATLLVVAHELGHVLGREHVAELTEVMTHYQNQGEKCIDGHDCKRFVWAGGDYAR